MPADTITPTIEVAINNSQRHLAVDPASLERLVRRVLQGEAIEHAEISIALVDDAAIHALNRRHLDHDWPTDVITFPLSDPDDQTLAGEVVISAEMAVTTAKRVGAPAEAELALYLVHGLLHLCGYDDHEPEDRQRMRRREDEILAREGLTNTFPLVGPAEAVDEGRESARWAV